MQTVCKVDRTGEQKQRTKPEERKKRTTSHVTHRSMKSWSSHSVQDHCGAKSWRLDAKKGFRILLSFLLSSLPCCLIRLCDLWSSSWRDKRKHTQTHTQRATLDPNSLRRPQCKQWQGYCRIHRTGMRLFQSARRFSLSSSWSHTLWQQRYRSQQKTESLLENSTLSDAVWKNTLVLFWKYRHFQFCSCSATKSTKTTRNQLSHFEKCDCKASGRLER